MTASSYKVILTTPTKRSGISVPRFFCIIAYEVLVGRGKLLVTMKRNLFSFVTIVSIVGMLATCFIYNNSYGQNGEYNGHQYVDLGLPSGTKWATCNIGANSPQEYGKYYAWGELSEINTKNNYLYSENNPTTLPYNADIATINWGGGWRIPTKAEFEELVNKCKWTWMSNGYKVVGPNGHSIFLPAAGYYSNARTHEGSGSSGSFWSSSININDTPYAWALLFNSGYHFVSSFSRYYGRTVRPICTTSTVSTKASGGKQYEVIVNEAKIYEYYRNEQTGSTYMGKLGFVYKKGSVLSGEIVTLDNHGRYLRVELLIDGKKQRGFISLSDVKKIGIIDKILGF